VELIDVSNWVDWEAVATSVTLWVHIVNQSGAVKWLVDISKIVDEKSHGNGLGVFFGLSWDQMAHDLLVDIGFIIARGLVHPVDDGRDSFSDVVLCIFELPIRWGSTLVVEGLVNEMPS